MVVILEIAAARFWFTTSERSKDDEKKNAHFAAAANSFSPIIIHFDSGIGD